MSDNDVNVAITFNPMLPKYQQIQAAPDPAPLDYGKRQSMSFKLVSSDSGASLEEIEFEGDAKGPFNKLQKESGGKAWKGSNPRSEDGQFKYKIKIKDGHGDDHELDPVVINGNPP